MISPLFEKYISTHTASDKEEVAFATGRSQQSYVNNKRNNETVLKAVPDLDQNKEAEEEAEYNRKLDEAIAMCKRRK